MTGAPPPPPPPPPWQVFDAPPPPPPQPPRRGRGIPEGGARAGLAALAVVVAIAALGALGWGVRSMLTGDAENVPPIATEASAEGAEQYSVSAPRRSTAAPTTTVARPPAGATPCPPVYGAVGAYASSAAGTTITSCPFAEEVRLAYAGSGAPGLPRRVDAWSPVTRQWYPMDCTVDGVVTCRGGNDAVVHVY